MKLLTAILLLFPLILCSACGSGGEPESRHAKADTQVDADADTQARTQAEEIVGGATPIQAPWILDAKEPWILQIKKPWIPGQAEFDSAPVYTGWIEFTPEHKGGIPIRTTTPRQAIYPGRAYDQMLRESSVPSSIRSSTMEMPEMRDIREERLP